MSTATTHPPRRPLPSAGTVRHLVGLTQRGIGMANALDRDVTAAAVLLHPDDAPDLADIQADIGRIARLNKRVGDRIRSLFSSADLDSAPADYTSASDTPPSHTQAEAAP